MTQPKEKKKSIKLGWEGGLLATTEDKPVLLKTRGTSPTKAILPPKKIKGSVFIRTEKKGRAGNPVSILYRFSDGEAQNTQSLKQLCSDLKTKLACGGTVENGEIVLMMRDKEKLKNILQTFFDIKIMM